MAEGIEIELPAVTAIPLGFIANELITNAVKYGTGRITVSLEANSEKGYALSVANDGSALPEDFNPANRKGLGMRDYPVFCQTDWWRTADQPRRYQLGRAIYRAVLLSACGK